MHSGITSHRFASHRIHPIVRGKINTCKVVRYEWICCCQFEFRLSKIRGAIIAHQLKIWNATPKRMWRGRTMLNDHNVRLNRNVRLILRRWYGMPMPMPFSLYGRLIHSARARVFVWVDMKPFATLCITQIACFFDSTEVIPFYCMCVCAFVRSFFSSHAHWDTCWCFVLHLFSSCY